jgi:hypothetical protein
MLEFYFEVLINMLEFYFEVLLNMLLFSPLIRTAMVSKHSELMKMQAQDRYGRFVSPLSMTAPPPSRMQEVGSFSRTAPPPLRVCRR